MHQQKPTRFLFKLRPKMVKIFFVIFVEDIII